MICGQCNGNGCLFCDGEGEIESPARPAATPQAVQEREEPQFKTPTRRGTIQERFEAFDAEHPEVYDYLVGVALDLHRRGRKHYGMKAIYERARWHFQIEKGREDFKLCNDYHSRYTRKVVADRPELADFFAMRTLKS